MTPKAGFLFPGQGSQGVGMADGLKEMWPDYDAHLEMAQKVGSEDLGSLIDGGPAEALALTEHAQPALLLVSCGWDQVLRNHGLYPSAVAGHSLGEYSALVSAGVLGFEEALTLVSERGRLMSEASATGDGAMAAVLGLNASDVDIEQLSSDIGLRLKIEIANINAPGQVVISGSRTDIERVSPALVEQGARKVMPLRVSGAFHSSAMRPASEAFAERLAACRLEPATVPVVQNSTGKAATAPEDIRAALSAQMTGPVLWEDSIKTMVDAEIELFVEVGPGAVLKGLAKRVAMGVAAYSVDDPADRQILSALGLCD